MNSDGLPKNPVWEVETQEVGLADVENAEVQTVNYLQYVNRVSELEEDRPIHGWVEYRRTPSAELLVSLRSRHRHRTIAWPPAPCLLSAEDPCIVFQRFH